MKNKNADMPATAIQEFEGGEIAHLGLTKREHLAGLAMQACRSRPSGYSSWGDLAADAVEIADALLAELERTDDH